MARDCARPSGALERAAMGFAELKHDPLTRHGVHPAPRAEGRLRGVLTALLLTLLLSVAVGWMAYQAPPVGSVRVGWLGDRLFLGADAGLGAEAVARGELFADDLTADSPTGRSRWTRQHARITLPNLGPGADLELRLVAQGWPADVRGAPVAQPVVAVSANGVPLGSFAGKSAWATFTLRVPAAARIGPDLVLDLVSSHSFTNTATFGADPREKGVRLAELAVRPAAPDAPLAVTSPAWPAVLLLVACALLLFLLLARLLPWVPAVVVATSVGVGLAGVGLAAARIWMGATLSVALVALAVLLAVAWQRAILGVARGLVRRYVYGRALSYGLTAAALVLLGYALAQLFAWMGSFGRPLFWQTFPDSLLYGLFGAGLLALVFVLGRTGLPRLADRIVDALGSRRGALLLLAGFAVIWLGYEAWVIAELPYVGHADYADNAVVARNLVAGRGWVVDYVSQFYTLNAGVTRPQETWPLLQPVWIAPFFLAFGPSAWAAKIPNLLFNLLLLALVYHVGARLWDRRVGLTAAIFTLTSYLFFRLTIYVTSDLGFVVFSFGALYWLYRVGAEGHGTGGVGDTGTRGHGAGDQYPLVSLSPCLPVPLSPTRSPRPLVLAGVLTGLMLLQKPSGAMLAVGMGLWLLGQRWAASRPRTLAALWAWVAPVAVWAGIALLILSPYLVRNMALFGRPVYSTESNDAWVLGYLGNSGDAWEEIYRVFTPALGGPGTPDRSWILRWGFDKTLDKLQTQAEELRNYLMPVWRGLPASVAWLFSVNERKNLLSDLGAWLTLLGVIGALRFRRRLLGLLALAYAPYMLFMLTYWRTDEVRYWVMLVPWLALLAAWMIWASYAKLAALGDRRWAPLGLILALLAIAGVVGFSRPDIANKVRNEPVVWAPDLAAYRWLDASLPADTVVLTRIPWQFNWHTQRPAVMIPNTGDRALLLTIARHYGATYLVLENQQRVKGDAGRLLAPLLNHANQVGQVIDGFTLVYASPTADFRAFVYRLPDE